MPLSRRSALGVGVAGLALVAGGCSGKQQLPAPYCVPQSKLTRHDSLGDARLVYDVDQNPTSFWFDNRFYNQLAAWLDDYLKLSGTSDPDQIWTFGSWLDGHPHCDSWHDAGRAFDLSRLVTGGAVQVSARYDIWGSYTDHRLPHFRTRYWALAATLNLHFAYVLTYLYNGDHHNHIHIDNGRSGDQLSTFEKDSVSQVQAVQAMLTYIWGKPTKITGRWNSETKNATKDILRPTKIGGSIDDGDDHWRSFLRRTASRGSSA